MWFLQILAFVLSSILTLAVIHYKIPVNLVQEVIIGLLLVLLATSKKVFKNHNPINYLFKVLFLFLTSLLVQLLVLSTGAIYSPFLILIHLYILTTSFMFSLPVSASFLITSVLVVILATFFDPRLYSLFQADPWSAILYSISFLVIIPIAYLSSHTYHLKETFLKLVSEKLEVGAKREQLVMRGLEEIVIITGSDLRVVSTSGVVYKMLGKNEEALIGSNLFQVLKLIDKTNVVATPETLSINQVLDNKLTHIIEGAKLVTESGSKIPVTIQVNPILDSTGTVTQLAFVFSLHGASNQHSNLELVKKRSEQILDQIKKTLEEMNLKSLAFQVELYGRFEHDLEILNDIENDQITTNPKLSNVAFITRKAILEETKLARFFNISCNFKLPEEYINIENSYFNLMESKAPTVAMPITTLCTSLDSKLLKLAISKLLDIAIFIVHGEHHLVKTNLYEDKNQIKIAISAETKIVEENLADLFLEYYGNLHETTNLKYSSGLEGLIATAIFKKLNINLNTRYDKSTGAVVFELEIPKNPTI